MSDQTSEDLAEFDTSPEEIQQVLDEGVEVSFGDEADEFAALTIQGEEEFDPYDIDVENVEVHFITRVRDVKNLGEALETASLNLITNGIGSYFVLLTDQDSGREWVAHGGLVGVVSDDDEPTRGIEDVQLPE